MKRWLLIVIPLALLAGAAVLFWPGREKAPVGSPTTVGQVPGVEYRHITRSNPRQSIYIVSFDLAQGGLALRTTVGERIQGIETVPQMVINYRSPEGEPVAAVNGDYFEYKTEPRFQGTMAGINIEGGQLLTGPAGMTFWVDKDNTPHIKAVGEELAVEWPDGVKTPFALNCSTSDFKNEVRRNEVVLFTPEFGPTTHTLFGRELVLTPGLPLRPKSDLPVRVKEIRTSGDTPILPGTMVLSIAANNRQHIPPIKAGDFLTLHIALHPDLTGSKVAISGLPVLLIDGKPGPGLDQKNRAPRTAIGYAGTRVWLVVVDGRQPALSAGMTYQELADLLLSLGCTDALNLDGGGSTTLWFNGDVRNSPSDGKLRPVGNTLMLLRTK